jgi:hypothetical protein
MRRCVSTRQVESSSGFGLESSEGGAFTFFLIWTICTDISFAGRRYPQHETGIDHARVLSVCILWGSLMRLAVVSVIISMHFYSTCFVTLMLQSPGSLSQFCFIWISCYHFVRNLYNNDKSASSNLTTTTFQNAGTTFTFKPHGNLPGRERYFPHKYSSNIISWRQILSQFKRYISDPRWSCFLSTRRGFWTADMWTATQFER